MRVGILPAVAAMPPRIAMQKFVEGSQNLRQTTWFVEGFAFDKPLSSKFVEKKFVEGSLKVITSSLITDPNPGCTHSAKSTDPPSLVWNAANTPRRRSAASAVGLPQRPAAVLVLIVARGCGKRFFCRLTHFAASAVPKTMA